MLPADIFSSLRGRSRRRRRDLVEGALGEATMVPRLPSSSSSSSRWPQKSSPRRPSRPPTWSSTSRAQVWGIMGEVEEAVGMWRLKLLERRRKIILSMKVQLSVSYCNGEGRRRAPMAKIMMRRGRRRLSLSHLIGRGSRESSSREVFLTVIRPIITGSNKARTQTTPLIWIALKEGEPGRQLPWRALRKRARTWWRRWISGRRMWKGRDGFVSSWPTCNRYPSTKSPPRSLISRWLTRQSIRRLPIFCQVERHLWKQIVIHLQTLKRL